MSTKLVCERRCYPSIAVSRMVPSLAICLPLGALLFLLPAASARGGGPGDQLLIESVGVANNEKGQLVATLTLKDDLPDNHSKSTIRLLFIVEGTGLAPKSVVNIGAKGSIGLEAGGGWSKAGGSLSHNGKPAGFVVDLDPLKSWPMTGGNVISFPLDSDTLFAGMPARLKKGNGELFVGFVKFAANGNDMVAIGNTMSTKLVNGQSPIPANDNKANAQGDVKELPNEVPWTAIVLHSGIFSDKAEGLTKNLITLGGQPVLADGTQLGVLLGFGKDEKQVYAQSLFGGTELNIKAITDLAGPADKINKGAIPLKPMTLDEHVFGPISLGVDAKTGDVIALAAPPQYWLDGLRQVAQSQSKEPAVRRAPAQRAPQPKPQPSAPAKVDKEKQAASKLRLAKNLMKANPETARKWLAEIVRDFDGTAAAKEAKLLLE